MDIGEFDDLATSLPGVRRRSEHGLFRWQCQGRLIARQLDDLAVVIRVPFDVRDVLVQQAPRVFSVPPKFDKHMMVVADLSADDAELVEQAVTSAWRLQAPSTSARR